MIALALLLAADTVLAAGGELAGPPEQTLVVAGEDVTAWGFSEVPPRSRLQAALALSDANARAELVKFVRATVTDALKSRSTLTIGGAGSAGDGRRPQGGASTGGAGSAGDGRRPQGGASNEEIEVRTREVARGLLPALAPPQHGWRKLKRGDEVVLQVWSRMTAPAARLRELMAAAK